MTQTIVGLLAAGFEMGVGAVIFIMGVRLLLTVIGSP